MPQVTKAVVRVTQTELLGKLWYSESRGSLELQNGPEGWRVTAVWVLDPSDAIEIHLEHEVRP